MVELDASFDASLGSGGRAEQDASAGEAGAGGAASGDAGTDSGVVTIYDIQKPSSTIPSGAHVVLDGPIVSEVLAPMFFMQEVTPQYNCDEAPEPFEYRAIQVYPTVFGTLAPGQHVHVEGDVGAVGGNAAIVNATVTAIGAPGPAPLSFCDRNGDELFSRAFESLIVSMAGQTIQRPPNDDNEPFQLTPCQCSSTCTVPVTVQVADYDFTWSVGCYSVVGPMVKENNVYTIEVPTASAASGDASCTVCL